MKIWKKIEPYANIIGLITAVTGSSGFAIWGYFYKKFETASTIGIPLTIMILSSFVMLVFLTYRQIFVGKKEEILPIQPKEEEFPETVIEFEIKNNFPYLEEEHKHNNIEYCFIYTHNEDSLTVFVEFKVKLLALVKIYRYDDNLRTWVEIKFYDLDKKPTIESGKYSVFMKFKEGFSDGKYKFDFTPKTNKNNK